MKRSLFALLLVLAILLSGCSPAANSPTADSKATQTTQTTQATEATVETEVATKSTAAKATSGNNVTKATTAKATTTATQSTTKATAKPTIATKATQATTKAPTKATTAATVATKDTETESNSAQIETDEKLLSVEIKFPASMFEDEDMATFDAKAYANEQGFTSAKMNADGSVTVTMTKAKHKELLHETSESIDEIFQEFVNGEDTPYIKEISHNNNFTTVTMKVDAAEYENAFDLTPLAIGLSVAIYQSLIEIEYHVDILIVDAATGATIETVTYPMD